MEERYLKRWILSCDDQVKVISPISLAQELAQLAVAIGHNYEA